MVFTLSQVIVAVGKCQSALDDMAEVTRGIAVINGDVKANRSGQTLNAACTKVPRDLFGAAEFVDGVQLFADGGQAQRR